MTNSHIQIAADAIENGGVIAYPTEAVFGMGCSPWNEDALERLLLLKQRPLAKGLITVAASKSQLNNLVDFARVGKLNEILQSWPGPVTWVMPAHESAPQKILGENQEIAVRISAHPVVSELCRVCGPIISTSANTANQPPAKSIESVRTYFGQSLDYILSGELGSEGRPTEIRHARTGRILRAGGS
ncbi:MAG: threonylcarbamoyl-AMP synthase [Gammaproteobacteria bacterium]|nr:threonylcarbamoyl-AMP synthase [Gammaproteobacteria bacterium]